QIDLATLDELHHADVGEQLGHGSDTMDGCCGRGDALPDFAKALCPHDLLVVDECDRDRWHSLVPHLVPDPALESVRDLLVTGSRLDRVAEGRRAAAAEREDGTQH